MTVFTSQLSFVAESTYGTPVTTTRFLEFDSESFKKQMGRVESMGHRSAQRLARSDRFEPFVKGVTGAVTMPVSTKSMGLLFKHAFGGAAIASVVDANYIQTFIPATKTGLYLTGQVNRPINAGTASVHTFHGLKITSIELSCEKDGILMTTLEFDGEDEDTATGLAAASYATDTRVFSFGSASATIDAGAAEVESWKVRYSTPMNVDRRYLRGSALKKEPLENAMGVCEWEIKVAHTALTNYGKFVSATRAGALGALVLTCDGPIAHGGTTLPLVDITIPSARFDDVDGLNVASFDELSTTFSGIATDDDSLEPVTLRYRTTDAAA